VGTLYMVLIYKGMSALTYGPLAGAKVVTRIEEQRAVSCMSDTGDLSVIYLRTALELSAGVLGKEAL
jgi:hypothetical protein